MDVRRAGGVQVGTDIHTNEVAAVEPGECGVRRREQRKFSSRGARECHKRSGIVVFQLADYRSVIADAVHLSQEITGWGGKSLKRTRRLVGGVRDVRQEEQ